MDFILSHIFREGNCCVGKLANFGLFTSQIRTYYVINRLGLPNFRFVKFLVYVPFFSFIFGGIYR